MMIVSLISCNGSKEGEFKISGTIAGTDTGWILLKKREEGKWVTKDSIQFEEEQLDFHRKG